MAKTPQNNSGDSRIPSRLPKAPKAPAAPVVDIVPANPNDETAGATIVAKDPSRPGEVITRQIPPQVTSTTPAANQIRSAIEAREAVEDAEARRTADAASEAERRSRRIG